MTLGEKLRTARQAAKLTQAQVAGDRITRNMLSQLENDLAHPSMRTLDYLADQLGVTVSWLLSDAGTDAVTERRAKARMLLRTGEITACLDWLGSDAASGDEEERLIYARCSISLAEAALMHEDYTNAARYAEQALTYETGGLYCSGQTKLRALAVLARCAQSRGDAEAAVAAYRQCYLQEQEAVCYHLLMARFHLEQEHIQAAEREIWSIAELPEQKRAEYLILRGRIAVKKEQYENARLYLQQAESAGPLPQILERELCRAMELCCRELGDFQAAYTYAARQLQMPSA